MRWIKVTDSLPVPNAVVFVTVVENKKAHICVALFSRPLDSDPEWYLMEDYFAPISLFSNEKQVVAWMPPPEQPYKEEIDD